MAKKGKKKAKIETHQLCVKTGDQVDFFIGDQKINDKPVDAVQFIEVKLHTN